MLNLFLIQVEEIQPGYSKPNYVFLAKVSTKLFKFSLPLSVWDHTGHCSVCRILLRLSNALTVFVSFLWQCYKDLGQRERARKMCEAASSMNSVSKEVDLTTVLL